MTAVWSDLGPISQGKILTALLRGEREEAVKMLRGWSINDLVELAKAANALQMLSLQEQVRRYPPGMSRDRNRQLGET